MGDTTPQRSGVRLAPAILILIAAGVLGYLVVKGLPTMPTIAIGPDDAGWTRSANYTSCDQWTGDMTEAQRQAMAKLLLPLLRRTVDTAASDGDELVPAFVAAVSATCQSAAIQEQPGGTAGYMITAAATLTFVDDTSGK